MFNVNLLFDMRLPPFYIHSPFFTYNNKTYQDIYHRLYHPPNKIYSKRLLLPPNWCCVKKKNLWIFLSFFKETTPRELSHSDQDYSSSVGWPLKKLKKLIIILIILPYWNEIFVEILFSFLHNEQNFVCVWTSCLCVNLICTTLTFFIGGGECYVLRTSSSLLFFFFLFPFFSYFVVNSLRFPI
jgi:hypothetical protein